MGKRHCYSNERTDQNLFGGSAVNAAQGIAAQVNEVAYSFVSNFMTTADP